MSSRVCATIFALSAALALCAAPGQSEQPDSGSAPPSAEELLSDKDFESASVVGVSSAENRWLFIESCGMLPILAVQGEIERLLSGKAESLSTGTTVRFLQYDYSEMLPQPSCPPVMEKRRYLVLLRKTADQVEPSCPWTALPDGVHLIRGKPGQEFIYWQGQRHGLKDLAAALNKPPMELDRIESAQKRLKTAQQRMETGELGDGEAFVRGLVKNVRQATQELAAAAKAGAKEASSDRERTPADDEPEAHEIWYKSLVFLRDAAQSAAVRKHAHAALKEILATVGYEPAQRTAALALAQLGDASGAAILAQAIRDANAQHVSADPPSPSTFLGHFPYDSSLCQAAGYALARLGDPLALDSATTETRLSAADGLLAKDPPACKEAALETLAQLAKALDAEVQALSDSGELSKPREKNDLRSRHPRTWIKAHALLARNGNDASLLKLLQAWASDQKTYPQADDSPVGDLKLQFVSFDAHDQEWPGLASSLAMAEQTTAALTKRLRKLAEQEKLHADANVSKLLRAFENPVAQQAAPSVPLNKEPDAKIKAQTLKLLKSLEPSERADGYASAGRYRLAEHYEAVLKAALHGEEQESMAAVFALGLYGREVPRPQLEEMMSTGPLMKRFSALELATRKDPARFASAALELARQLAKSGEEEDEEILAEQMPRLLVRLARQGVPAALTGLLSDPEPALRKLAVQVLFLAADPACAKALSETAAKDSSEKIRLGAKAALKNLGPAE